MRVKDASRKAVSFRVGNLLEPASYDGLAPLDVVFCRNVLIYFSDAAMQRAVRLFHEALAPGGYLFLGHAESLARVSSTFVPIRFQGAIVYQKPEEPGHDREPYDPRAGRRRLGVRAPGRRADARDGADIQVVGIAGDGEEGLAKARELRPDVVTLDVKMPRLGGLETLERLMAEQPVPVLLMSTLTQEGAEVTLRGLELGAMDFVDKSSVQPMSMLSLAEELIAKVRALGGAPSARPPEAGSQGCSRAPGAPLAQCVVLAASTGGPTALQVVISGLPAGFPAAVLVVQHIPRGFTKSLAERLDARSAIPVREARDGEAVEPGTVLIAPAGIHSRLARRGERSRSSSTRSRATRCTAPRPTC